MIAPVAIRAVITMLAISQNPDRVSNIFRSSSPTSREVGTGGGAVRTAAAARSIVNVLMLLLLLAGSLR